MKSAFALASRLVLVLCLLGALPVTVRAQDSAASPTPLDAKAQERALKEAKKAAEKEAAAARAAAEKERKEAESAAKKRAKTTPSTEAAPLPEATPAPTPSDRELEKARKAEEKAQAEAEKSRKKEDDRIRAEEAKESERRRKDEERAQRESAKARAKEEEARPEAVRKDGQAAAKADKDAGRERARSEEAAKESAPGPEAVAPSRQDGPSKGDEKKRRELVRQIEKARTERDRLNQKAEEADQIAKTARSVANESQRAYEALTTGLDIEDVTPTPEAPAEPQMKKSRFLTKADTLQMAAPKEAPKAAADPLRIALDLKKPLPEDRERAAFALASLGPEAQPATRALMAALADTSAAVRTAAAQALGRIGPGASAAVAPLSAALTDPDPAVKNAAQAALLAIQGR